MDKQTEWFKIIGAQVAVMGVLVGILSSIGMLPWATQRELREVKDDYKAMIQLKNTDNEWYRELSETVAFMKSDISHVKGSVSEIKQILRDQKR